MINRIMKKNAMKSLQKDLDRLDLTRSYADVSVIADKSYAPGDVEEHKLDVYYVPDGNVKPVLIDIHGGGFISEDKEMDCLFCNFMAHNGFVVFSINYRLAYPDFTVFDQIIDVDAAVKWVVDNAQCYEGNRDDLYIAGHSAGAVLAVAEALLSKDEMMRSDYKVVGDGRDFKGLILDCGAMHFYQKNIAYWGMRNMVFPRKYKKDPRYKYLLFDDNRNISLLPPVSVITNKTDELRKMSYHFADVLAKAGVECSLYDKGEGGHMGIIFEPYEESNSEIISYLCNIDNYPPYDRHEGAICFAKEL